MTDYKLPPLWLPSAFKNDYTKDEMRSYAGLAVAPLLEDLAAHEASNRIKTENLETLREQNGKLREALVLILPMLNEWHEEFPDHVGDKELPAIDAARAAIGESNGSNAEPSA